MFKQVTDSLYQLFQSDNFSNVNKSGKIETLVNTIHSINWES